MAKYLKDHVKEAGGVLLMVIDSIGSPHQNERGKDVRHVSFKLKSTGTMISEDVFNIKFVKYGLKGATSGDNVEAFTNDEGYIDYRIVTSDSESSAPLSQTPSQQVKTERAVAESFAAEQQRLRLEDEKWRKIDMSKIVFGYMIAGLEHGKTPEEAKALAIKCEKLQRQAVDEIILGIPSAPAAHSPELVKEVEQQFGTDTSIPLPDGMNEYNE